MTIDQLIDELTRARDALKEEDRCLPVEVFDANLHSYMNIFEVYLVPTRRDTIYIGFD